MKFSHAATYAAKLCLLATLAPPAIADDTANKKDQKSVSPVLDFKMKDIDGKDVYLGDYQGDVLMIVNVASRCGLTPQYAGLEALHRKYKDQGLRILAFPANDFGAQEPGSNEEIKQFCTSKFAVSFDMFAKVSVKGKDMCPLYKLLTDDERNAPHGGEIKWNFQKFLVDRKGRVVGRFEPPVAPQATEIVSAIEKAIADK